MRKRSLSGKPAIEFGRRRSNLTWDHGRDSMITKGSDQSFKVPAVRIHVTKTVLGLLLMLPMIAGHYAPAAAQRGPASVIVERVVVAGIEETTPVIAQLVGSVEANVAARRDGIVREVHFDVGDRISQGQELVRLDDELLRIQYENATAALQAALAGEEVATARMKLSRQAFERQSGLQGSAAFSKAQFEDLQQRAVEAQGELSRASAQVAVARAVKARVEYDIDHSVVRAPFDGIAMTRTAQPGQYVSLGGTIGDLLDMTGLEIEADVPVELLGGLSVGRIIEAKFADSVQVQASVRTILPEETVSTRTRPVRLDFELGGIPPYLLAKGTSVTLNLPVSAARDALLVPKDALVQGKGGGWTVFAVRDGQAILRPVTLGQANNDKLEVLSGLEEGDYVVVRGNERLRENQKIKPVLADGTVLEQLNSQGGQSGTAEPAGKS